MAGPLELATQPNAIEADSGRVRSRGSLDADIIIANAPDPVFVSDLEGKILQANDAVSQLLGFRQDEVLEQSLARFISREETREFRAALREVVERGVMRNVVLNPRSAGGEVIPTSLRASALRDARGRAIGVVGTLRDMRELDKARAYAESLIKNAPDPVFVSDLEGKILQANDAVFALLGFRPDELIEQSLSRIISADETREFLAALREVVERGVTRNARLNPESASGEDIPTTLNASALRDPDGKVIGAIGILRDMRELDKARAYAESLIKNAPDPVFVSDLEGKILQANDAVSQLLGFRQDELLEQSLSRFISPEETREFTAVLREVVERGWMAMPKTVIRIPGSAVGAESRLPAHIEMLERRLRQRDEQRRAMLHILVDYEQDRRRLARQTERLDSSRRAVLHILQDSHKDKLRLEASRKAMIHIMGNLRETTAEVQRREQELRDKQEQLVQAGKLATLGELTTGVAHELNNPLNNIGLFVGNAVDLIELAVAEKGQIVRELRHAMQQVGKATEIISHLRTFGRAAPASRQALSLRQVIDRALSLMREQLRLREIEVAVDLGPEEPVVVGNPIQLEQVFINLLTNARDAVADSPRKAIRISGSVGAAAVEVVFADSGHGIPPGLERRIFDPFVTTKEVGKGTGLGLSITYGIVKEHGGAISVVDRLGEGATFLIQLPLATPVRGEL